MFGIVCITTLLPTAWSWWPLGFFSQAPLTASVHHTQENKNNNISSLTDFLSELEQKLLLNPKWLFSFADWCCLENRFLLSYGSCPTDLLDGFCVFSVNPNITKHGTTFTPQRNGDAVGHVSAVSLSMLRCCTCENITHTCMFALLWLFYLDTLDKEHHVNQSINQSINPKHFKKHI